MIKFIENIGDYFSQNYFDEEFPKKVFSKSGFVHKKKDDKGERVDNHIEDFNKKIGGLREKYFQFKNDFLSVRRIEDKNKFAHNFNQLLLDALGYSGQAPYDQPVQMEDDTIIPVRNRFMKGDKPYLYVMEMTPLIREGDNDPDGLYEQNYTYDDWEKVLPKKFKDYEIKPEVIKDALSELFLLPEDERPKYVILLGTPKVFLLQFEKWKFDSYLLFDIEELFEQTRIPKHKDYLALFYALLAKKQFVSDSDSILSSLEEDAHKASYGVTQNLKNAVVFAVQEIANEAILYRKSQMKSNQSELRKVAELMKNENFARELKDECLTFVYRLLFLFYAESREDLEILPTKDSVYQKGYSLEMLRDLEMVNLRTEDSRNGFFFSDTLWQLFDFVHKGSKHEDGFELRPLDSPLFDNTQMPHLSGIRFRNFKLQEIIRKLSLTERTKKKGVGRISYANLGINQLGSVYESLLAYSGFFANEAMIEVKAAKDKTGKDGTFVVPYSRRGDFKEAEILKDPENPKDDFIIPEGHFVYRLNGRDRKKSASYYTPEVLTQCTVHYTLKGILDKLKERQQFEDHKIKGEECADEILELKILEPAMGAAAFHNEVINQLAVAYLELKENEEISKGRQRITPGNYKDELQKVKAYIAANNVYGVDINPTAVELGKLSLWLNCMHKNMETPFFAHRLGVGNAVVGAWLKVYKSGDFLEEFPTTGTPKQREKSLPKEWWNKAPKRIEWKKAGLGRDEDEIYHFLLPDSNMVPSYGIKLLKEELTDDEKKAFTSWKSDFTSPISKHEYKRLVRISKVIDYLFEEHYKQIKGVIKDTTSVYKIYGQSNPQISLKGYDEKERLAESRNDRSAPYYKLKMIMDYWCSLWFWDVRELSSLPSREEWYNEIESLLQVDTKVLGENVSDEDIKKAIKQNTSDLSIYGNSNRLELVEKISKSNRFFHNELEFCEVFKERNGFDVIVGNPPWLKLTFEAKSVISLKKPEVEIKKMDAARVDIILSNALSEDNELKAIFTSEWIEIESVSEFMGANQNYPLLQGQQTNLYKCVVSNAFLLLNNNGFSGILHPETIFDDPNGQPLRKEIYPRLKFYFRFQNALKLFAEIGDRKKYCSVIYSGKKGEIKVSAISNLFHPSTIYQSFGHGGNEVCEGIKVKNPTNSKFEWNLKGHSDRIIKIGKEELQLFADVFENGVDWSSCKMVSFHSKSMIDVIEAIRLLPNKIGNVRYKSTECHHETNAVKKHKYLKKETKFPDVNKYELVYSGPHFYVSDPLYKTPRSICTEKGHYDVIDKTKMEESFWPRTNYIPNTQIDDFIKNMGDFEGVKWVDKYKLGFSKMLNLEGERTLQGAILAPKISHINGLISVVLLDNNSLVEFCGLCSSIPFDFFIKTLGASNLTDSRIQALPMGVNNSFRDDIYARVLRLNCLNSAYKLLWEELFNESFKSINWTKDDQRLSTWNILKKEWKIQYSLQNYYERRQALVEIDVLCAMSMGLSLEHLILMFSSQFPVLEQNEDDTWYDQKGNIVFTCSKGLTGVGLDRGDWDKIKDLKEGDTYEYVIPESKTELYAGQSLTFYAPFDKCDRIEDYKTAWAHFEKVFTDKN